MSVGIYYKDNKFHLLTCYIYVYLITLQLHERFEKLKKEHTEEKKQLDEKRRQLEEEMNFFNKKKQAAAEEAMHQSQTLGKKGKNK